MNDEYYIREAIKEADKGITNKEGGPFGAIVVKNGEIIARGNNKVTSTNDPTAHAEIVAIRNACKNLNSFQLDDCVIYSSCEPCPMCLGAIYWARPSKLIFAASRNDASDAGFDDSLIYREIALAPEKRLIETKQILRDEAIIIFDKWIDSSDKTKY
ncbi:MAG: nucleoside deaminase [Flavobacteriales bacterium]|nr:nucleoside deaminase [Flavobacteriales bacterium]